MNTNPVAWFEIYVNDMTRARAFYEAILGITLLPTAEAADGRPMMWMFPGDDNASGALVKMEGDEESSGAGGTLIYFSCQDCDQAISRVAANGGRVIRNKYAIAPYGFIALIEDTDGNRIGLHSHH